jgi:hypothetical protein
MHTCILALLSLAVSLSAISHTSVTMRIQKHTKDYLNFSKSLLPSPTLREKFRRLKSLNIGLCLNPTPKWKRHSKNGERQATEVTMISTEHWKETRKQVMKYGQEKEQHVPLTDYNENMGGVDLTTNSCNHYLLERMKESDYVVYINF